MSRPKETPIAATFAACASAEGARRDLLRNGLRTWMAELSPPSGTPPASLGAAAEAAPAAAPHSVAASSDGIVGALGRYFSGERSLVRALVDHGVSEPEALEIDRSAPPEGAVLVVDAGDRADEAASLLARTALRVIGGHGQTFAQYPSTTDTVPGQADELDRGTDIGRSGGGLGATTGFWDELGAQKDLEANHIFYERRSSATASNAADPFGDPPPGQ